jgi:hypothetical protein
MCHPEQENGAQNRTGEAEMNVCHPELGRVGGRGEGPLRLR